MKLQEVIDTIPVALQELADAGHDRVDIDQLGRQLTSHEPEYLERRSKMRSLLSVAGIKIDEIPSAYTRPGGYKLHTSLAKLEEQGVVTGELEKPRADGKPARRVYFLASP